GDCAPLGPTLDRARSCTLAHHAGGMASLSIRFTVRGARSGDLGATKGIAAWDLQHQTMMDGQTKRGGSGC
ncbi:MAG: hypothetical protein EBW71_03755, partial [Betaproteobacteria bacterium]|nr:hypothetical protein [Betaproteobacteria bacterium]